METKMKKLAKQRKNLLIPMIINVIVAIVLVILSGAQSEEINHAQSSGVFGASLGGWYRNVCQNKIVGSILSPFAFNFKIIPFDAEIGIMGCPWRVRNTVYRLLCVCLIIIITLYQIIVLLYKQKSRIWNILYWIQYILYLAMILVLVLDCDGIWNGYHACLNNFDMQTGYGPILLNLLAVQWMTTQSPSWCLGAVGSNLGPKIHEHFGITDGCYLTPFIYTAFADAALIIFTYISYKLARYYIFDHNDYSDDEPDESMTYDNYRNRRQATINTRRIYGKSTNTPRRYPVSTTTRGNNTTRGGNKRGKAKASISLTEPAHWKSNSHRIPRPGKTAPSPAYVVEKSSPTFIPNQPIDGGRGSIVEPNHWIQRKPTYEKNYS